MSKARDIADERLVKGEITKEEHTELVEALSASDSPDLLEKKQPSTTEKKENDFSDNLANNMIIGGLVAVGFVLYVLFTHGPISSFGSAMLVIGVGSIVYGIHRYSNANK